MEEMITKMYTLKELESVLGVSNRTLQNYIRQGRLRAVKMGKWRVSEENLQAFINGVQPPTSTAQA
jgi:excisionase family DNA binding protein